MNTPGQEDDHDHPETSCRIEHDWCTRKFCADRRLAQDFSSSAFRGEALDRQAAWAGLFIAICYNFRVAPGRQDTTRSLRQECGTAALGCGLRGKTRLAKS